LSESELARELVETTGESTDRASRARIAKAIRRFGDYRWVGVYDVGGEEIALLGWDGPGAPGTSPLPKQRGPLRLGGRRARHGRGRRRRFGRALPNDARDNAFGDRRTRLCPRRTGRTPSNNSSEDKRMRGSSAAGNASVKVANVVSATPALRRLTAGTQTMISRARSLGSSSE
jgi:hypothetical protein